MREVAAQRGVNINVPYLAYVMFSEDLRSFGGNGIGNGANGFITLGGSNLWIPGIAHEMIHMFSVNHANIREAGSKILGGEIQEGRDSYFFMGSEGDQKNCPLNTNQCEIFATLSLPHKGRLGWITSNEYIVSENDGDAKTFTIFNHDNTARNRNKRLGVYLTRYDKKGVFVISYLKVKNLNQRERLSTDGLMVHYVPYAQPKVSELLDLTPNSIRSNSERPSDPTFTDMHDAGDGAIGAGKRVNVSNLFRIQVLNERVESGQNNNSVRFKITPLTCPTINLGFSKEDFVYERVSNNDPCIESFSESWNLDNDSKRIARINGQSLG